MRRLRVVFVHLLPEQPVSRSLAEPGRRGNDHTALVVAQFQILGWTRATTSSTDQGRRVIPAATAGVVLRVP